MKVSSSRRSLNSCSSILRLTFEEKKIKSKINQCTIEFKQKNARDTLKFLTSLAFLMSTKPLS